MSRKREGLVDLLHWSRRPSTCDQTGPRKDRDERPNTGSLHGSTNGGSSLQRQSSHIAQLNRGALPPLSRTGSIICGPGSSAPGGPTSPESPAESLSHFQEALYVNGQPHNATSRLLRLGAGSPLRRSGVTSAGPSAMPPLRAPPTRTQSATLSVTGMVASSPESSGESGHVTPPTPPYMDILGIRQPQPLPLPQQQQQLLLQSSAAQPPPPSPQPGPLPSNLRPSTAWSVTVSGSPPRPLHRFPAKDNGALLEEARQKAQEAMDVLCRNQEISAETRAQAISALQELEALLGPREINLAALMTAARSLRSDLCKELHSTDKQAIYARAQMTSLQRQHELLRHQLRTRPDPIVPPSPLVAVTGLSDTGTPSMSPKYLHYGSYDALLPPCSGFGSLSAPQSPMRQSPMSQSPMSQSRPRLESGMLLPPRPGYYAAAAAAVVASGASSNDDAAFTEGVNDVRSGNLMTVPLGMSAVSPAPAVPPPLAVTYMPPIADYGGGGGGGLELVNGGQVVLNDKWSLAGAMARTLHLRAIHRVEAALQAVAAEQAEMERPRSGGLGEVAPPVDVEELRRLKHTPQGLAENLPETPSYIGVSVRRTPSPGALHDTMRCGGGLPSSGCLPGASVVTDPRVTLQWSNRGISTAKMHQVKEALATAPHLLRLCFAGNKLANEDVMELMCILSEPTAPRIQDIILDQNTNLSWRCALPLALALGMSPDMAATSAAADWAAVAAALPPSTTPATLLAPAAVLPSSREKIRRLPDLRVLSLCGVKLGDKGVSQLAEGLRANNSLLELDLRRCGISDSGGSVLMDVLESNGRLQRLDVSWNALRTESARVLEAALAGNAGLRVLSLANNGFGDLDGARVIKGLLNHGRWLHVDLSHNTLGPGSCMMIGELLRRLGAAAASLMVQGTYAESWPRRSGSGHPHEAGGAPAWQHQQRQQDGLEVATGLGSMSLAQTSGSKGNGGLAHDTSRRSAMLPEERSAPPSPTSLRFSAGQLGSQLHKGQPILALDGNPLGSTGLRIILDAMEAMSQSLLNTAGLAPPNPTALEDPVGPPGVPPLPLHVSVAHCNVAPPSERLIGDSNDEANPFLPSIAVLCIPPPGSGGGGRGSKKPGAAASSGAPSASKSGATKDGGSRDRPATRGGSGASPAVGHAALTLQSPHLDLQSPAGVYSLDLTHPATAVLVSYLLRLRERLSVAAEAGLLPAGVAVAVVGISINGKSIKVDQLSAVDTWSEGTLQLTVKAPAVLALEAPLPLSPLVACWLVSLLGDPTASPLWKLSVIQAAGSVCLFTPGQCLALLSGFDRDTQATEAVTAAQMLYARSAQPLAFWEHVLPRFSPAQQAALRERVGDLVALDMTRPMGRYTLNLGRLVDRFVALRLQLTSALESSWVDNKYYVNWLNASFNGQTLDRPGLTHIRDYTLPGTGVLRLDYVSYKKPGLGMRPVSPEELSELLARLRRCTMSHICAQLQVRAQVTPPPQPPLPPARLRSPIGRRKQLPPPPPPKPRLTAFQLMHISLRDVAHFLASPEPPQPQPQPQPQGSGGSGGNDGNSADVDPPPPPPPPSWTQACGFDPEPLFRRTGVLPPDLLAQQGELGLVGSMSGPLSQFSESALALGRAMNLNGAKSARSAGAGKGKASVAAASTTSARMARRRSMREKEEEEEEPPTQDDYHAALFAMVHHSRDLPLLATKMGATHLGAAVAALLRYDGGIHAAAALVAALPPLTASKFLYDQTDSSPCLMPSEVRRQMLSLIPQERSRLMEAAARAVSEAALVRARQVRTALNLWSSQRHLTCDQVEAVLGALHTEGDRVAAMVVLWPRFVDGKWKRTYLKLKLTEQRQVMTRLGFWHVYTCLADPHGISFSLDLREPEQREIARELVRMAVKETMRAKQEARARGGIYTATLLDLHGNGNPVSIPEDEKLWGMADSNFKTMDFLYCPTFEQSLEQVARCAVQIQRFWGAMRAKREARMARAMESIT